MSQSIGTKRIILWVITIIMCQITHMFKTENEFRKILLQILWKWQWPHHLRPPHWHWAYSEMNVQLHPIRLKESIYVEATGTLRKFSNIYNFGRFFVSNWASNLNKILNRSYSYILNMIVYKAGHTNAHAVW
jgi:hypothetical protein